MASEEKEQERGFTVVDKRGVEGEEATTEAAEQPAGAFPTTSMFLSIFNLAKEVYPFV